MKKQYEFQKLTPSDNVQMGVYESAMDYAFANDDIRNVAISGVYGAGKSSMIESYKKAHDKKFIHISLAHFTPQEKNILQFKNEENSMEATGNNKVTALEGKIINQLIHQIDPDKIPETHFKIKKDTDYNRVIGMSLIITLFIAITCFLKYKKVWENMINAFSNDLLRKLLLFTTSKEIELLLGMIALLILGIGIFEIITLQKRIKPFRKMNFQGYEIEIFEETKDSYFDKYLNEVLYIFEHAGADGIIFEDIDRYDNNLIFEKLREINYLLNQKNRVNKRDEKEKIIKFFYLIRDDIFDSKERIKFFDFIIPIVPVIDASNAYDKFIEYFENSNILELFERDFLQGLSLYVDDMRLLKNICNEFVVYQERLKTSFTEKSNSKLLAMIAYKNIFPKDFGDLQVGKGYVHTLFTYKEKFRKEVLAKLQDELVKLQDENVQINSETCNDMDELNSIYFAINGKILVDKKEETAFKTRKEFVKAILNSSDIRRVGYSTYNGAVEKSIDIENERKAMEEHPEYVKRKILIQKKISKQVEKNNQKIVKLKGKIEKIEHAFLKDIIIEEGESDFFALNYENVLREVEEFKEIKRSPYFDLIKFLIRSGYIDETYSDYMTYFYANSITANDKSFLRSITDKLAKSYDYKLDNVELIVSRMRLVDFKEEEAFNFMLLEELLSDTEKYEKELTYFLDNIYYKEPVEFVSQFLQRSAARKNFVVLLNESWYGACNWIITEDGFTYQDKKQYLIDTICACSEETILDNNQDNEIIDFIENDPEFLDYADVDLKSLESGMMSLGIKFNSINFETANNELLQYIYNNNMYQIEIEMIQKILVHFYGVSKQENRVERNLSLLLSKRESPICRYISDNIDLYIKRLLAATSETWDDPEVIIYVLNNKNIMDENKVAYIASVKNRILYLKEVQDIQLWNEILDRDKVEENANNLYDYYYLSGNGMDDRLIHYINCYKKKLVLNTDNLDDIYGNLSKQSLFSDIINSDEIEDSKYKEMIRSFGMKYSVLDVKNIPVEKIDILIDCGVLQMNKKTLTELREKHPDKVKEFILNNIQDYVKIMDKTIFSSSELLWLLEENIAEELKLSLLEFESEPITITNAKYPASIQKYILENLFCEEDLNYILGWYPQNDLSLRKQIFLIAMGSIDLIKKAQSIIHEDLLFRLVEEETIEIVDKKLLLARQIHLGIRKSIAKRTFKQLKMNEYISILEGKRPKVKSTISNEMILKAMLERKWLSSYEKDKDDSQWLRTYGKKVKKEDVVVNVE